MARGGVRTNLCVRDRFAWSIHPRDDESLQFPRSISAIFYGWVRTCYLLEVNNTLLLKAKVMRSQAPAQTLTDTLHEAWCACNSSHRAPYLYGRALAGENQAELFSGQAHHFDTRRMNTPLIHDSFSTEARVPDVNTHLECNEVVQDWDVGEVNDGVDSLKNRSVSSLKSQPVPETDGPQFYDDVTPPNSPVANHEDEKGNLLHFHNEYVNHLLNLWRESSEYNVLAESTHVELDQFEYGNRWNAHSDQEFAASQSSISSGNGSQESDDISMEEGDSASSPEFTQPSSNMFSFTSSESGSRSNSPLNLRTPGPYDRLRSVSPRILRSPSPVFPVHRLLRSPSPNWEELQANLSDLTPQDLLLFADERYSVRSRSPHSVSDQEVPDIEMDVQSFYSDSDEYYNGSMNRVRTAQSCDDQVVPEMIEE